MIKNKGFTLIELLVVISIIGILAVIVLSSLNSAGEKGANAGIKSNATSIRSQAGVYWVGKNQSYDGFCDDAASGSTGDKINNDSLKQALDTAKTTGSIVRNGNIAQSGDAASGNASLHCNAGTRFYVVSLPLRAVEKIGGVDSNFWCVDSKGFAGGIPRGLVANAQNCASYITP